MTARGGTGICGNFEIGSNKKTGITEECRRLNRVPAKP